MPKTEELPDSLSKLARRQAIVLTDLNFGDGIGRLMQAVDLPTHANDTSAPAMRLQNMFRALAAALVLLVAAGTYLTWRTHSKKAALDVTPANPPPGVLSLADLKNAYRIPKNLDGRGQTIGMIELDGGFSRWRYYRRQRNCLYLFRRVVGFDLSLVIFFRHSSEFFPTSRAHGHLHTQVDSDPSEV